MVSRTKIGQKRAGLIESTGATRARELRAVLCGAALLVGILGEALHLVDAQAGRRQIPLPSSKLILEPVPGTPRPTNSFPATIALHPRSRYLAILNNGYGTADSGYQQSIAVLELETNQLRDFPDHRFPVNARQTYFFGMAFSADGNRLYVSVASFTDPA